MAAQAAAPRDPLRVAVESFRPYWEIIQRRLGRDSGDPFNAADFCVKAGITKHEYDMLLVSLRKTEIYQTLPFGVVDQIAWELDSSVKTVGVAMSKMRDAGWDLPYRGHRFKNRDEGLALAA
jgi:hypothetical protein